MEGHPRRLGGDSRPGPDLGGGENIKRHTAMIDKVLLFMVTVADQTELTLDPIMDSYYMMDTVVVKMPAMLEPWASPGRGAPAY